MSAIEILAAIAIIGFVIFQQVKGGPLRRKRTVVLPAIVTAIGFLNLPHHLASIDITWVAIGAVGSATIGLAFGAVMRLDSRNGYLWARLPLRGLWLWAALIAWRVAVMVVAIGMHAHVAASTDTLLFGLGVNRLGQAAVIMGRAAVMGVPFAPEEDAGRRVRSR
jgi:hypothetical protein